MTSPGFGERGRMRRRARFLRKARELAYRDLGGLVFDLHRFGERNDTLVLAKLETIGRIDDELRAIETALTERRPFTVLREAGVAACPRCAAIHGSEDRFCPNCGLAMDLRAERPVAGPQNATAPAPAPLSAQSSPLSPPPTLGPSPSPGPPSSPSPRLSPSPSPSSGSSPGPSPSPSPSQSPSPTPPFSPPTATPASPSPAAPPAVMPTAKPAPAAPPAGAEPPASVEQPTEIIRPPAGDR